MEILTGKMKHIIFHNDETNYYVLTVVSGGEVITATGCFRGIKKDVKTDFYGEWVEHPKFGKQFSCGYWENTKPVNTDEIVSFLSAKTVKGIGHVTAKRIVDTFGRIPGMFLITILKGSWKLKGFLRKSWRKLKVPGRIRVSAGSPLCFY